jgi:hypothetical protein
MIERIIFTDSRFEAFTTVMIEVKVFLVVTPYSSVVGRQCYSGPCYLHQREPLRIHGSHFVECKGTMCRKFDDRIRDNYISYFVVYRLTCTLHPILSCNFD